jgi:hypothetical protein
VGALYSSESCRLLARSRSLSPRLTVSPSYTQRAVAMFRLLARAVPAQRASRRARRRLAIDLFVPWTPRESNMAVPPQWCSATLLSSERVAASVCGAQPTPQEPRRYRAGPSCTPRKEQGAGEVSAHAVAALAPPAPCFTAERDRAQSLLLVAGVRETPLVGPSAELPSRRCGRCRGSPLCEGLGRVPPTASRRVGAGLFLSTTAPSRDCLPASWTHCDGTAAAAWVLGSSSPFAAR